MRLGYLIPEFPTQTHIFFWREVQAFRALGHDVHLFSTTKPPNDACRHAFAAEAIEQTIYVAPPPLRALLNCDLTGAWRAASYIGKLNETSTSSKLSVAAIAVCAANLAGHARRLQLQHLHVHSCANAAHLAAIARKIGGPSYSLTLHGDLPTYGTDHAAKMAGAEFVSVVTEQLKSQVLNVVSPPPHRLPVIWMGVDTQKFVPAGVIGASREELLVATVARLNVTKGHRFALEAVAAANNRGARIKYVIAGSGPHEAQIRDDICKLGLEDSAILAGSLSEEEVLKLLQRADAFVLPSFGLGEAAPVSVMEAMSCGLPVICSKIGGTSDMIRDGVDGILCDQKDVRAIEAALFSLWLDADLRARLGHEARRTALTRFDYQLCARRLADEISASIASHTP